MTFSDKSVIWVTGASSGIGRAIAKEFAAVGAKVYVSARRMGELERLKKELNDNDLDIELQACNVASVQNVEQVAKKILAENPIDCLINAAGITSFKPITDNSINEIHDIVNTNLLGSIYTTKAVLDGMIERKNGTIINILSVVAEKIFANSGVYSASKAGLRAFSKVLREEVREHGIKIIDILPGATETAIWNQKVRAKYADQMMKPEDIARVVVSAFLEKSNMVSEEIVLRPITGDL